MIRLGVILSIISLCYSLPKNYEYYAEGNITAGLSDAQPYFTLNGKNISIYSGSMHYFRVPRDDWPNRLAKIRAAGLNTVETSIPWNLHEPQQGWYDFGTGGSDMEDFLHLTSFIEQAKENDLFVIIRAGPYISADFEFGGLPSWLLRSKYISVRSSDPLFMGYVANWFNVLMPILAPLQFQNGGPIIMFQVENELALKYKGTTDVTYLHALRQLMLDNGIKELLVTSDDPSLGTVGSDPDVFLLTGNFNTDPETNLANMTTNQPDKPVMVMEYWSGTFDTFGKEHNTLNTSTFESVYETILSFSASVNIYMFEGGTNFGFLNGASNTDYTDDNSGYLPIVTSYDYDAPLTESGSYGEKYDVVRNLMKQYNSHVKLPDPPAVLHRKAYPTLTVNEIIEFERMISDLPYVQSTDVSAMETLDTNDGNGQSYGYVIYRKTNLTLEAWSVLKIAGRVCDTVIVLVNGHRVSPGIKKAADLDIFGTWKTKDSNLTLTKNYLTNATLDLVVENWGRVNVGVYKQFKGLYQGDVYIDDNKITDWTIYSLEFRKSWINGLSQWHQWEDQSVNSTEMKIAPGLYKATLELTEDPVRDTYIYMENWVKGIVIVNGFVLGRYAKIGPQQGLYLPAAFLVRGSNDIVVFEHFVPSPKIEFSAHQVYRHY